MHLISSFPHIINIKGNKQITQKKSYSASGIMIAHLYQPKKKKANAKATLEQNLHDS